MANGGQDARTNPRFQEMEREFFQIFGSDKDFLRYLNDPDYAKGLTPTIFGDSPAQFGFNDNIVAQFNERARLLQKELHAAGAFEKIDLDPIFDPLKGQVDEISAQRLQSSRANISRQASGAQDRATENIAGSGLGRSGVRNEQVASIETRRQDLLSGAEQQIEAERLQAMFKIGMAQAQAEHSEALQERGYTLQQIQDALNFDRLLFQLQFEAELEAELQGDSSSMFGDLIDIGLAGFQIWAATQTGGASQGAFVV